MKKKNEKKWLVSPQTHFEKKQPNGSFFFLGRMFGRPYAGLLAFSGGKVTILRRAPAAPRSRRGSALGKEKADGEKRDPNLCLPVTASATSEDAKILATSPVLSGALPTKFGGCGCPKGREIGRRGFGPRASLPVTFPCRGLCRGGSAPALLP